MGERHGQRKTNIKAANVTISTLNPVHHSNRAIKTNTRNPTKYLHIKMSIYGCLSWVLGLWGFLGRLFGISCRFRGGLLSWGAFGAALGFCWVLLLFFGFHVGLDIVGV
jgi:hypothetical protein